MSYYDTSGELSYGSRYQVNEVYREPVSNSQTDPLIRAKHRNTGIHLERRSTARAGYKYREEYVVSPLEEDQSYDFVRPHESRNSYFTSSSHQLNNGI